MRDFISFRKGQQDPVPVLPFSNVVRCNQEKQTDLYLFRNVFNSDLLVTRFEFITAANAAAISAVMEIHRLLYPIRLKKIIIAFTENARIAFSAAISRIRLESGNNIGIEVKNCGSVTASASSMFSPTRISTSASLRVSNVTGRIQRVFEFPA